MIVNHDIANVREFSVHDLKQKWKGYFCNSSRKNWQAPPLNNYKAFNSRFIVPTTRTSAKISPR